MTKFESLSNTPNPTKTKPLKKVDDVESEIRKLAASLKWTTALRYTRSTTRTRSIIKAEYPLEKRSTCYICEDVLFLYESATLLCGHTHCHSCIRQNYETVIRDPKLYPPRCCEPLELKTTIFVLSTEQLDSFMGVKARSESRKLLNCAYCDKEMADAFTSINQTEAYCVDCKKLTCVTCGKAMHKSICPEGNGVKELIATAEKRGWSPCPKCNRIIEKRDGCNYVYCLCGTYFCYVCGNPVVYPAGTGCQCMSGGRVKVKVSKVLDAAEDEALPLRDGTSYQRILQGHQRESAQKQKFIIQSRKQLATIITKKNKELAVATKITDLREELEALKLVDKQVKETKENKTTSRKEKTSTTTKPKVAENGLQNTNKRKRREPVPRKSRKEGQKTTAPTAKTQSNVKVGERISAKA
ncbi:hypothetical protein TWF694_009275 [Orbilia ellipsospora]|uniref:RBR-type E3 ubiquitin transferase n=1 Tax=Orbilia ellipsospora TaxID=2528407 RepID=A0AAV9XEF1_9PEZI